tara:strand:- start:426 stop:692 length:267 start_codon:yes stop_codon:yes gene_type:complete
MNDIIEKLVQIAEKYVNSDILEDKTNWDMTLSELGLDSLNSFRFLLDIEDEFNINEYSGENINNFNSLNAIIEYLTIIQKSSSSSNLL